MNKKLNLWRERLVDKQYKLGQEQLGSINERNWLQQQQPVLERSMGEKFFRTKYRRTVREILWQESRIQFLSALQDLVELLLRR